MKKIAFLSFLIFPFCSFSQSGGFLKNDFIVTSKLNLTNLNTTQNDDFVMHQFNFSTGEMLSENIAAGIEFGFGSNGKLNKNFSAGLFARYYFTPKDNFSVFTKTSLQYFRSQTDNRLNQGGSLICSPGVSYFLTKHIAVEAFFGNMGFSSSQTENNKDTRQNNFVFGFDATNISFGVIIKGN